MKTKEFIEKVEALNYGISKEAEATYIYEPLKNPTRWLLKIDECATASFGFDKEDADLSHPDLPKVMKLAMDYIFTPIEERKEESKFRVHLLPGAYGWLNFYVQSNLLGTSVEYENYDSIKSIFTKSEYAMIRSEQLAKGYVLPEFDQDNTTTFVPVEDGKDK